MNDDELSALVHREATRHRASEALRAAVRTQLALHEASRADDAADASPRVRRFGGPAMAAAFASGALLALVLSLGLPRLMRDQDLPAELVADHVRALKTGRLFELASADRHTVKPWFQGRLDYAPQVFDLRDAGFPLLGGRVETVQGRATAALAYARRRHTLNVFVWPADSVLAPQAQTRSGFNLLHWADGSMHVWVVADAEAAELERFRQAWQTQADAR